MGRRTPSSNVEVAEMMPEAIASPSSLRAGRRCPDEGQAGKQRIARGEQFPGVARNRIDGAHPSEDHRCVDQSVDPRQTAQGVVPKHADGQSEADERRRQGKKADDAPKEPRGRQQRISPMLEHSRYGI